MRCWQTIKGKLVALLLVAVTVPVLIAMIGLSVLILQQQRADSLQGLNRGLVALDNEIFVSSWRLQRGLQALEQREDLLAIVDLFHRFGSVPEAATMLELE